MNRILCSLALVASVLGLNGCERYRYVYHPPQGEEGQQCVARCEAEKQRCIHKEDSLADHYRRGYESEKISYDTCMHFMGSTPSGANACRPPSPPSGPSYKICNSVYSNCYERCGGRIEKVRVDD